MHTVFSPTLMTGTVVKRKRGKLLADLAHPGDEVLVARGGQGGVRKSILIYFPVYLFQCNSECIAFVVSFFHSFIFQSYAL